MSNLNNAKNQSAIVLKKRLKFSILPVLYYNLFLGIFILMPVFIMIIAKIHLDLRQRTIVALIGTLIAEIAMYMLLIKWVHQSGKSLTDLGWGVNTNVSAIILGIFFSIGYILWTFSNPLIIQNAMEISLFKIFGVLVGIVGAIVEEIVFRGFVLTELSETKVSIAAQIFISGLAFALIHIGFNITGVIITFIMGMVLSVIYIVGRRSLTPSLISHMLINILIEPWLLMFIINMYSKIV
ncbi:CPBP family intramembrane glutamic endopeptidase [Clostridium pasteurianum]|uniref:CAAX amino terminal protease family n=1 Tax=Clostridium pasteurianum BC1 TaxID=86416 RepID=R4KB13_CLOPA|nr:type II CAAX endopeptidase family protein [Clostridium pasteurianum]AGK96825.1 CAAX amino terminal protease family [Clostridium pasteurianum BC1]